MWHYVRETHARKHQSLNYNVSKTLLVFAQIRDFPSGLAESILSSGVHKNFVRGWGGSTNSVEDRGQREQGSVVGNPLVKGSGGSCNLVQEISFHIVKFS